MNEFAPLPLSAKPWDRTVMSINCQQWLIRSNIRNSIRRQLPQMCAHPTSGQRVAIVGGGWSLKETERELRDLVFNGVKIVAVNGAANYLAERNFKVSMHIVADARPVNAQFFEHNTPDCQYYLASQCHPKCFDAVEGRDVTLFHVISTASEMERKRLNQFYNNRWQEVPSAGTVGIIAIILCRLLGFPYQHLFGVDSCYRMEGEHHAYPQDWNNQEGSAEFWIAGRSFRMSAWQASQCGEFIDMVKTLGDQVSLDIHGDGVLAHIMKTGADMDLSELNAQSLTA